MMGGKALRNNSKIHTDHLGNKFTSQFEMCAFYGITAPTFLGRLKLNWSIEKALTTKVGREIAVDHKGIEYDSFTAMCIAYNKGSDTIKYRLLHGWTLEDSLETDRDLGKIGHAYRCEDHKGMKYSSLSEMCTYYGISKSLYNYRLKLGWDKEKALETPVRCRGRLKKEDSDDRRTA